MFVDKDMIYLLIPIFNESKNIERCIFGISKVLRKKKFIIYAVNDGSKDNSLALLKVLHKKYPIKILNHPVNLGVAEAFKTGLKAISKVAKDNDILIIMEGDATSDASLIPSIIKKIASGKDVVIASRYKKGGTYKNFPAKRLFISHAANFLFRILYPAKEVRDYTIFYRGYRWEVIKKVANKFDDKLITTKYFTANAELLVKIMKVTKKIDEVPFVYDYSNKKGKTGLNIKRNLIQYYLLITNTKFSLNEESKNK